ncbi:hypothetical protein F0562_003822 [Nyssa sinensis]|uniref:Uncharacterized protein n=1 Tax=Nyssa sinensis TaxID=561372 RepID=A0A5J5BXB1_9ASTE|nr:hypothetical protein F0562_003822 [Nyssa sinensis]
MAWDLSWEKIPGEFSQVSVTQAVYSAFISLCKALHNMAVLSEIKYEPYDLESQLQQQLLSSNEATQKIEELKKKVEDIKVELRTTHSLIENLKKKLAKSSNTVSFQDSEIILLGNEVPGLNRKIFELRSDLSIVETVTSKAEMRHRSKIKVARVDAVKEQKDKILKLG